MPCERCYWASSTSLWVICPLIFVHIRCVCVFPLIPYQTPSSCRFERRYDNYQNEAYLAIVLDVPGCNRRTSRRPVPWPWELRLERSKDTELSWEMVMTWSDIFDSTGLQGTDAPANTPESKNYNQEAEQHLCDGWNQLCWAGVLRVHWLMAWKSDW